MKKVFTLVLVMAIAITSFAQVKGLSRKANKLEPAQAYVSKGFENLETNYVASPRNLMTDPEETELSYTTYDWQTNAAARNFVAVWPDGYAVMCYTIASGTTTNPSDRGTGLAIWDPAVGEWEFTTQRVEDIKTGYGSIARYKENGLVIAAHTSIDMKLFFCEDFRNGSRDFNSVKVDIADEYVTAWPVVQCSGENLDIVHVLATVDEDYATIIPPVSSAILYYRYENGEFTAAHELLEELDENHIDAAGSNITYFLLYNPDKPNRVGFVINDGWSDGKAVISEDNGTTWTDVRTFYQHPGTHITQDSMFCYPRWTTAAFDGDDNLHIAYEWNATKGAPGSGSYYPNLGGVAYWSEVLPKNELCVGGIGEVGQPFVMDSTYIYEDIYASAWYWSDALHAPVPENIGQIEPVDENGNVVSRDDPEGLWYTVRDHGSYNCGVAISPTMHYDVATDRVFVFYSQICGDEETYGFDEEHSEHYMKLFGNVSLDGGLTWLGTKAILTSFEAMYYEEVYDQVIPYIYTDSEGEYLWLLSMIDAATGTFIQEDDTDPTDNHYSAIKVYVSHFLGEEENVLEAAPMMSVYPNPAQGSFKVDLNNTSDVNIYNTVGQLVKTYNNVSEISVELEAGVYFVNANNQTVKVIVK